MGEFHAEDYKITELPSKPQQTFEESFASIDLQDHQKHDKHSKKSESEDSTRQLKPQRGPPSNKSWRENREFRPKKNFEEKNGGNWEDKRKNQAPRQQQQRGPKKEKVYNEGGKYIFLYICG